MHFEPLDRPSSLVDEVCLQISSHVRQPGQTDGGWLPPERQLATQLGVSRTVVREATKRLELQGLLEVQHGIGIRVVDHLHKPLNHSVELTLPDESERLDQLMEMRLMLEPEVASLAAVRITDEQMASLHIAMAGLEEAVDTAASAQADLLFHRLIAQAAGNRIVELLLESLGDLGMNSRHRTIGVAGKETAVRHHRAILAAIGKRQPEAARRAMRKHIEQATEDLRKHFKS